MEKYQEEFINKVGEFAKDDWEKFGILPSITIAQAILESSFGRSELATKANNLFGIKGDYDGYGYLKDSWEVIDGKDTSMESWFKHYPSWEEGIADHGQVFIGSDWRKQHYAGTIGKKDYRKASKALTGKYATDPAYHTKLISNIEKYNLTKFDPVFEEPKEEVKLKKLVVMGFSDRQRAEQFKEDLKSEPTAITDAFIVVNDGIYGVQIGAFNTDEKLKQHKELVESILPKLIIVE